MSHATQNMFKEKKEQKKGCQRAGSAAQNTDTHTNNTVTDMCSGPSDRKRKHLWETKNKYKINLYVTGIERRFFSRFFFTILFAPPEITAPGGFMGFRMARNHEKTLTPQRCRVEEAESRRRGVWVPVCLPVLLGAAEHTGGGGRRCLQNFLHLLP